VRTATGAGARPISSRNPAASGRRGLERHPHLGDVVLDLRVVRHRAAEGERALAADAVEREVVGAARDPGVHVREAEQPPGEDRELEQARAREPGRREERDPLVRHERAVEQRVVARGRAHAQRVPGLADLVAVRAAREEAVHHARVLGVARVHPVVPM